MRLKLVVAISIVIVTLSAFLYIFRFGDRSHSMTAEELRGIADSHFSSHTGAFDIEKAEQYYTAAIQKNPEIVGVNDQLSRIAFIQGDLKTALRLINEEIANHAHESDRNLYYIRGLIYAYMREYALAEQDYAYHFRLRPQSWASHADYAWVLLKQKKNSEAIIVLARGLELHPENPWLLNLNGVALYEAGISGPALDSFTLAERFAEAITEEEWLRAYPGNDPSTAGVGIETLQKSIKDNIHRVVSGVAELIVH